MRMLEQYLEDRYADSSYEVSNRVRLFFRVNLIIVPFLIAFFILLNVTAERDLFSAVNVGLMVFILFILISTALLFRGYYHIAVNLLIFILIIGMHFIVNRTLVYENPARFVASNIPIIAVVVFGVLLCRFKVAITVAVIAIIGIFINFMSTDLLTGPEKGSSLTALLLTVILAFIFSGYIIRIGEQIKMLRNRDYEKKRLTQISANKQLLESLVEISGKLDSTSKNISENSENFSRNMQGEASSMEEITATIEEISSGLESVSLSTKDQSEHMDTLEEKINFLYSNMKDMESSISSAISRVSIINEQARSGQRNLADMDGSMSSINSTSNEMTGIVNMITDISDQINLLSLNASIEAARAGDYGRGFAVVADEISKLADKTSGSVKEIERLIKQSESEIKNGMQNVAGTVSAIGEIIDSVTEIGSMIESVSLKVKENVMTGADVNAGAERVKSRSDEIDAATGEHRKAAEEIVKSVTGVNELIQSNALSAQSLTENIKDLSEMTERVRDSMMKFDMSDVD